jgi:hypothetical protein
LLVPAATGLVIRAIDPLVHMQSYSPQNSRPKYERLCWKSIFFQRCNFLIFKFFVGSAQTQTFNLFLFAFEELLGVLWCVDFDFRIEELFPEQQLRVMLTFSTHTPPFWGK